MPNDSVISLVQGIFRESPSLLGQPCRAGGDSERVAGLERLDGGEAGVQCWSSSRRAHSVPANSLKSFDPGHLLHTQSELSTPPDRYNRQRVNAHDKENPVFHGRVRGGRRGRSRARAGRVSTAAVPGAFRLDGSDRAGATCRPTPRWSPMPTSAPSWIPSSGSGSRQSSRCRSRGSRSSRRDRHRHRARHRLCRRRDDSPNGTEKVRSRRRPRPLRRRQARGPGPRAWRHGRGIPRASGS